jgi:hypothetical protein
VIVEHATMIPCEATVEVHEPKDDEEEGGEAAGVREVSDDTLERGQWTMDGHGGGRSGGGGRHFTSADEQVWVRCR